MRLQLDDEAPPAEYAAAAVVYNDGAHWWADMLASGHYKQSRRPDGRVVASGVASYRSAAKIPRLPYHRPLVFSRAGLTLTAPRPPSSTTASGTMASRRRGSCASSAPQA